MDNQTNYQKDGVALIIDLLRENFGSYFKEYYSGQPNAIPKSNYPCVMVTETNGTGS